MHAACPALVKTPNSSREEKSRKAPGFMQAPTDGIGDICTEADLDDYLKAPEFMRLLRSDSICTEADFDGYLLPL